MFGHSPYYFSTIKTYVSYFGNCFNDIHITRSIDSQTQVIKVPVQYSKKDKALVRADADPDLNRPVAIVLPRIGFAMTGLYYDGPRKLNMIHRAVKKDDTDVNKFKRQFTPVPYNFSFEVYVYVKNTEDGLKIIEQILPFFTPEWTASLNIIPEMDEKIDVPIILNSVEQEDTYDSNYEERRMVIWTLRFTLKGVLYGPVVSKPIIKVSNTQFFMSLGANASVAVGNSDPISRITVTPGLDANGDPTTDANTTIPWNQISVDDDFGYIITNEGIIITQ